MRGPDAYPTVSGVAAAARLLSARHPDLCRIRLVGESRAGRPLWLLSVGHGHRHVLVVAGANPDQQAGGATVRWLAEQAVHDRRRLADADLTWDFLLCLDPDGTVLNETGPAGERPAAVHFRHTYRPAVTDCPEQAAHLPENRALSAVIDALHPELRCTLHGTDVGGSLVRLSADLPGLSEPFGKYAAELDVPVRIGTCEAPFWASPGPGVYVLPPGAAQRGPDAGPADPAGATWDSPHPHDGLTALVEVPMWATRRIADPAPHPDPGQAVTALAARLRKDGAASLAALERTVALLGDLADDPMLRGAEQAAGAFEGLAARYEALADHAPAPLTMAQVAAFDIAGRRIPLHASGMLLRLLDQHRVPVDGDPNSEPARLRSRLERRLDAGARDLVTTMDARWVPVGTQAELQARTVLATVERLG
ncbi:M14 family zinc carboxypeptidase [Streptomyces sp. NBC_01476]|uniref:M14 family zinc carboxypeptidase n=1 Tax=Streptomyces sp. NBC_01476 TaxID=2903881 RepID=UPI002E31064F|nr:M14 family zinc carboxypeptidase [Streptomyces sp. NBC_01476]